MTLIKREAIFTELSCNADFLIPTEVEKVGSFIEGMTYSIRVNMARESERGLPFRRKQM